MGFEGVLVAYTHIYFLIFFSHRVFGGISHFIDLQDRIPSRRSVKFEKRVISPDWSNIKGYNRSRQEHKQGPMIVMATWGAGHVLEVVGRGGIEREMNGV